MIRKGHHIDDYFSAELGKLDITPPEVVWDGIEKKLNQKKKLRILWYKAGLAAGIALIMGISGLIVFSPNKNINAPIAISNTSSSSAIENTNNDNVITKNNPEKNSESSGVAHSHNSIIERKITVSTNQYFTEATQDVNDETLELFPNFIPKSKCESQNIESIESNNHQILNQTYASINKLNAATNYYTAELQQEQVATEQPLPRRWTIDCEFAPTYAYRAITNTSGGSLSSSAYNSNESGLVAWSGGIKAGYKLNEKFKVKVGLYYSIMGQRINNLYTVINNNSSYYYPGFNVNQPIKANKSSNINIQNSLGTITNTPNNHYDYNQMPNLNTSDRLVTNNNNSEMSTNNIYGSITYKRLEGEILQKLHYIDIPVLMHYTLLEKKLKCHILGGINAEILYKTTAILKTSESKKDLEQNIDLKPVNLSSVFGLGIQYPIRHKIHLLIEPTFKYSINSVLNSTNRDVHLYSFNLYTGFSFTL